MSKLKVISLSYINTPVEVRELFSFTEKGCKDLLLSLREKFDINESIIISTCNRTEIYYVSDIDINEALIDFLMTHTEVGSQGNLRSYFKRISDPEDAVRYLFEVSTGLHAQVIGDIQIIGQVKNAYQWAADVNMAGPFLHRLMHTIFFTNKRIVQETSFRDGAASISYAATELVDEIIEGNKNSKILLLGTGEIGRDTAHNLISFGYKDFTLCNRTLSNATDFANELSDANLKIIHFQNLFEEIAQFDVIISAIEVTSPIITAEKLKGTKIFSHKYFIDLSVPRSIDKNIEEVAGVLLFNIEDLNKKTSVAQQKRLAAIPHVNSIINEAIEEFSSWTKEMEVSPTIHKIKNALEIIRQDELARYNRQLTDEELKLVDVITKNIMQKIIKLPVVQLKAACKRGEADSLVEILNELFDLENQKNLK